MNKFFSACLILVTLSLGAASFSATTTSVSQAPKNEQAEPESVSKYQIQLKVGQKHNFNEDGYEVLSGDTNKMNYDGQYIWFSAPGTYVLFVDGWFNDFSYSFNVTR